MYRRVFGNGENPADAREALLGVNEFGELLDIRASFDDPVMAGDAGVERARFDVAGHFLGADEKAFDFGVVDGRDVAARVDTDFPSGAAEEIDGGVLQAAFRNAELEAAHRLILPRLRLRSVNFFWIEGAFFDDLRCAFVGHAAEEAAAIAFVANAGTDWIDADEQRIGVAVDTDVADFQDVAAGRAFLPEAIAGAGEEDDFARTLCFGESDVVHEAEHEDVAGRGVLDNGGDESVRLREVELHHVPLQLSCPIFFVEKSEPENKKPAGPFAPAGDENPVLANRYAHLIKRGAVP